MNIVVSNLIMENLDSFAKFIIDDYWKIFPRDNSRFIQSFVCRSKTLGSNLNTIDYKWIENDTHKIYGCTHCFVHLDKNYINIMQHGLDTEKNQKHWDYIKINLPIFERDLKIKQILE